MRTSSCSSAAPRPRPAGWCCPGRSGIVMRSTVAPVARDGVGRARLRPPNTRSPATMLLAQRRVVVEEADRADASPRVPLGRAGEHDAGPAGAVQQRRQAVGRRRGRGRGQVGRGADREPDAAQDGHRDERLDDPERARETVKPGPVQKVGGTVEHERAEDRSEHDRADDPDEIGDAGISPAAAVQAQAHVRQRPDGHQQRHHDRKRGQCGRGGDLVQAEGDGDVSRENDRDEVERQQVGPTGPRDESGDCPRDGREATWRPDRPPDGFRR